MMYIIKLKSNTKLLPIVILFWVIYTVFYGILRTKPETEVISGYMALIGEVGFDFVAALLCFLLWKVESKYRSVFLVFFVSFIMAGISNFIYNLVLNINQTTSVSVFLHSSWDIPFVIFLGLQTLAWGMFFYKDCDQKADRIITYFPYLLAGIIIFFTFTYGVTWKIHYLSVEGIYQLLGTIMEVLGFVFASFCLIRSKVAPIRYLSIGYLFLISSDFILRYSVVTDTLTPRSLLETTWVLGLLIMITGFFLLYRTRILYGKRKCLLT